MLLNGGIGCLSMSWLDGHVTTAYTYMPAKHNKINEVIKMLNRPIFLILRAYHQNTTGKARQVS
jgi:hypothetical protein